MSDRRSRAQERPYRSQHFLNRRIAADLIARSSISRRDHVVEIGAGKGALTAELASRCRRLTAVEIDPALCRGLRERFGDAGRVEIVQADFLATPLPDRPFKVVGNIPYSRTADIVRRLKDANRAPDEALLITQSEAAARFAGRPFGPETRQSLLLKPFWHVEVIRQLSKTDFAPQPSVDSSVLWMVRHATPIIDRRQADLYRRFVTGAFGAAGPTISDGLRNALTRKQIRRLAGELGFRPTDRPSALSFAQWLAVFRFYALNR